MSAIRIGPFDVELIPMTHSVPSGNAVAFHTPQGVVLHSGDFKLDTTPVDGRLSDLARIGALASGEGIRLLLADSTNADEPGWAVSESKVGGALYDLFHEHADRRIVTVCFSSHIHRIQQIADAAIEQGRVVATLGLSMRKNVRLARSMGLLDIPERHLVDIEQVDGLDPGRVCVISTGSQGEPYSALALMASNQNRFIKLGPDDTVILSSHPDPGQRGQRQPGHERAGPPRCGGRAHRHRGRPLLRSRQAGGAAPLPQPRPGPSGSCPCTARPATWPPMPAWPRRSGIAAGPHARSARTATRSC